MADKYDELQCLAYIEGDLPPDQRARFEQTLAEDRNLRNLIADLHEQRRLLRSLPPEPVPDEVKDAAADLLARRMLLDDPIDAPSPETPSRPRPRFQLRRLAIAAAIVGAASVAATIYVAREHRRTQPEQGMIALRSQTHDPEDLDRQTPSSDALALGDVADDDAANARRDNSSAGARGRAGSAGQAPGLAKITQPESRARRAQDERAEPETEAHIDKATPAETVTRFGTTEPAAKSKNQQPGHPQKPADNQPVLAMAEEALLQTKTAKKRAKEAVGEPQPAIPNATTDAVTTSDNFALKPEHDTKDALAPTEQPAPTFADARPAGPADANLNQSGAGLSTSDAAPGTDDDRITLSYNVEDYEQGYRDLIALAGRHGAQVVTDNTPAEKGEASSDQERQELDSPARRVLLKVPETNLDGMIRAISGGKLDTTGAETGRNNALAGAYRSAFEAFAQENTDHRVKPFDALQTWWDTSFEQAPARSIAITWSNETTSWTPPMLPPEETPLPTASPLQPINRKTVIVKLQQQSQPTESE